MRLAVTQAPEPSPMRHGAWPGGRRRRVKEGIRRPYAARVKMQRIWLGEAPNLSFHDKADGNKAFSEVKEF